VKFEISGGPRDGEEIDYPLNLAEMGDRAVSSRVGANYIGWRAPFGGKPGLIVYYGDRSFRQIEEAHGAYAPLMVRHGK
jgi:hypothetical protein